MKHFAIFLIFAALFTTMVNAQAKAQRQDQYVKIETREGILIFRLSDQTPNHTANFIKLAKRGYFNRYDFNRVLKGFVAQGGETDSAYAAMEKAGEVLKRIAPEFSPILYHQKGALAAGRDDNDEKSSFLGQFYIVDGKIQTDAMLDAAEKRIGNGFHFSQEARQKYKDVGGVPYLDQNYTVFGQLIKGFDVLQKIAAQPVSKEGRPQIRIGIKVKVLSKREIAALGGI